MHFLVKFVLLCVGCLVLLTLAAPAATRRPQETTDETTAEGWAWARIVRGENPNFNERCDPINARQIDPMRDEGWDNACRTIRARFVIDALTDAGRSDQIERHGFHLQGAHIFGDLDLENTDIASAVWILESRIDGAVNLRGAHLKREFSLKATRVAGDFIADRLRSDNAVYLWFRNLFEGEFSLRSARIDGDLSLKNSRFAAPVSIDSARIGGNLYLNGGAVFDGEFEMNYTRIDGNINSDQAVFNKDFNAEDISVGQNMFLGPKSYFKGKSNLAGDKIQGVTTVFGSTFDGRVNASFLQSSLEIIFKYNVLNRPLDMPFARIGGGLDFRGSQVTQIDLSGATVAGELRLGGGGEAVHWRCDMKADLVSRGSIPTWSLDEDAVKNRCGEGLLDPAILLRNARIGAFQDTLYAWPPVADFEGFMYDRLGGWSGDNTDDIGSRSPNHWRHWLERQHVFSLQPYVQLAGVLAAAGRRDASQAILYAGKERERSDAFTRRDYGEYAWLTLFSAIAGYGIGTYSFRVWCWVLLFTLLGTLVLMVSPTLRARGVLWCFIASLHRILPIQFSSEYKQFFENAHQPQGGQAPELKRWQIISFDILSLAGWVLAFFLLAALGLLIPKS